MKVHVVGVEPPGHLNGSKHDKPRAVFAGSKVNKLNRLGAAFGCKVSDPAFVVGMRTIPLIPAGIWKSSSMPVIGAGESLMWLVWNHPVI